MSRNGNPGSGVEGQGDRVERPLVGEPVGKVAMPVEPEWVSLGSDSASPLIGGEGPDEQPTQADEPKPARKRSVLRELIETALVVVVVFVVVRLLVQNFVVEGDSMLPTLHNEQYLLVNKAAYFTYDANFIGRIFNSSAPQETHYLFGGPSRGDIVVFASPSDSRELIKRVIALQGETVEVKPDPDSVGLPGAPCGECGVYVNGVRLDEPYIRNTPNYTVEPVVIPPGHVYVLGDNRRNSSDSHVFGPLKTDRIVGSAFLSYLPFERFGFITRPAYSQSAGR